jgi:hypothetical protein
MLPQAMAVARGKLTPVKMEKLERRNFEKKLILCTQVPRLLPGSCARSAFATRDTLRERMGFER